MSDLGKTQALRAYELGRVRVAATRGLLAFGLVAIVAAVFAAGGTALLLLPVLAAATFAEWRGGALARGTRRGVLVGLVTLILPLSVLRPCCDATNLASGACCGSPSLCAIPGLVIGLSAALVWPAERSARAHLLAGLGVALGALATGAVRCAGLFAGEAVGLSIGLAAGVVASSLVRALVSRRGRADSAA